MNTLLGIVAFTLTAASAEEIFIRANQVGFHGAGAKTAVAFSHTPLPKDFTVVGASNQVWFHGKTKPITTDNTTSMYRYIFANVTSIIYFYPGV